MIRLPLLAGLCLCFLLPAGIAGSLTLQNQLADHASPYLAMHGHDPVAWQDWDPALLERARQENRLLFISSGYFSCHWCHVMQKQSYQDTAIAALLNRHFLPVKIDRELEPALDAYLIEFVELTRGHAGWPLNVFLTPDGYPLTGFTYLPKARFHEFLQALSDRWQKEPGQLADLARRGTEEIISAKRGAIGRKSSAQRDPVQAFLAGSREMADELSGGFGQQTKFPMVPQLEVLLEQVRQRGSDSSAEFLRLTLEKMADLGLRDHLGEGFFRYVTDPHWQVPHFEKMLYDNAQLARLYLNAGETLDEPRFREIGLATLDFILQRMAAGDGAFVSSFSAVDNEGREGFYYQWSQPDLRRALTDDEFTALSAYWNLQGNDALEYGYLPVIAARPAVIAHRLELPGDRLDGLIASAKGKLLKLREARHLPVDDKRLAAWNGLLLTTLARAVTLIGSARYKTAAERLAVYLSEKLWDGQKVLRAVGKQGALGRASVEDYALVARGLADWARVSGRQRYQSLASRLVSDGWRRFYRQQRWYHSDRATLPGLGGSLALSDNPLPSASAVLTGLALNMPALRHDAALQKKVNEHLGLVRASLLDELFWYPGYVALSGTGSTRLPAAGMASPQ